MDYRDAQYKKEKPEKRSVSDALKARWWEVDKDERAKAVSDVGCRLRMDAGNRLTSMVRFARLYENAEIDSLSGRDYADAVIRQAIFASGIMSINVGASCLDTLTAKITKNRPRPNFVTSGAGPGAWDKQMKARNLDKWCRGYFYQTKVYQKARQVFVDSGEFGTGLLHVFDKGNGKLDCERVIASEIFVDDLDGQYAEPQQMVRLKYVSRDVLVRLFPKKRQEILEAGRASRVDAANADPDIAENTIEVWEAWHLPSGEGAKDGMHVIAIDDCTLLEEEWKVCRFPFAVLRFKKRTTGFWGKGVIETVQGYQIEINRVVRSLSEQFRRKGKGRTFVQMGSKVVPSHLTNNDGGDIIHYTGAPPIVDNNNAIAQEEFMYLQQLKQNAYQDCGVSEMSAMAKKPSGLDAAVAMREYSDIESERFAPQHQDWEQFFMDFADLSIDLITKQYGWKSYKVLVPGRRDLLEVDWADVDLDRDSYIMQMWPVSSLPQTPSARYQKVKEMMQDGMVSKPVAQRLLEFPDLEAEANLGNAMLDDVDATISAVLDDKEPTLLPLEPYQNFDLLIERANAAYLFARHRDCPEDRLSMLRNLIDNATAMKASMAQMAQPPAPPMGPPGVPPGAPPPMMGGGIQNTVNVPPPPVPPSIPPIVGG